MNFTCQRPEVLYGILLIIPALIIAIIQYRNVMKRYKVITIKDDDSIHAKRIKKYHFTMLCVQHFFLSPGLC